MCEKSNYAIGFKCFLLMRSRVCKFVEEDNTNLKLLRNVVDSQFIVKVLSIYANLDLIIELMNFSLDRSKPLPFNLNVH